MHLLRRLRRFAVEPPHQHAHERAYDELDRHLVTRIVGRTSGNCSRTCARTSSSALPRTTRTIRSAPPLRVSGRLEGWSHRTTHRDRPSIDGPGESAIGVFCQVDLDIPFTGYLGSVDTASHTLKISRVEVRGTGSVLAEDPIDVSISLSEPLDLVLRCMQENEIARISFTVDDTTVVEASDSSWLKGHSGVCSSITGSLEPSACSATSR